MAAGLAVTVQVELTPAQLAQLRAEVRAHVTGLVARMVTEESTELTDVIRDAVYRVIREDMTATADGINRAVTGDELATEHAGEGA
jgi:hypothetical protein